MHQIFEISEIVTIIAEEGLKTDERSVRKGILCLALTCHALYEPIADVIWRNIPNSMPLVKCIPKSVWVKFKGKLDEGLHPVLPKDLGRLRLNAARVRVYGTKCDHNEDEEELSGKAIEKVFRILSVLNGGSTLLPNLRVANINVTTVHLLPFYYLITLQELKTLNLTVSFKAMSQLDILQCLSFLCTIGIRYPVLENLALDIARHEETVVTSSVLDEILLSASWPNLSSLRIVRGSLSYHGLLPLLNSKTLREIDIWLTGSKEIPQELSKNTSSTFPNAECLSLRVNGLSTAVEFLNFLQPRTTPVRSIQLDVLDPTESTAALWHGVCECIHRTFRASESLKELALDDEDIITDVSYSLSLKEIDPLRGFTGLQIVKIFSQGSIYLHDTDIRQLAMAWPRLSVLYLVGAAGVPETTLNALVPLAEFCPDLEVLDIELNALISQKSLTGQSLPPRGQNLKELNVHLSPIATPDIVAAFISDIFPYIEVVKSGWEEPEKGIYLSKPAAVAWGQVDDLVKICSKVRRESEARLLANQDWRI